MFGKKKKSEFEIICTQISILCECLGDIEFYFLQALDCFGIASSNYPAGHTLKPNLDARLIESLNIIDVNGDMAFLSLAGTRDLKTMDFYPHTTLYLILNGMKNQNDQSAKVNDGQSALRIVNLLSDLYVNVLLLRIWLGFAEIATSALKSKDVDMVKKIRVNLQAKMVDELDKVNPEILAYVDFRRLGEELWTRIPFIRIEAGDMRRKEFYDIPMNETARQDIIDLLANNQAKAQIHRF